MAATDAQIIAAACDDAAAFAGLFDRHAEAVHRMVARRLGRQVADDIAGEVFRVAFEQRARFDTTYTSALPWLYGIALNLIRRHQRDYTRRLRVLDRVAASVPAAADPMSTAADRLDATRDAVGLAAALAALGPDDREVLLLVAWEQMTPTEAAAALGVPAGTARSRLHRARQALLAAATKGDLDG
ncbi:MAG: sigma-70 family RNA polymerase sigma factor [Ilumatobacteraceae bacterium]